MTTTYETENEFGRGTVMSWASLIDDLTRQQAEMTSRSPVVKGHVALMPDCHFGMGATVGSVMWMKGGVIPAAIGVDIGCGMLAVQTDLPRAALAEDACRRILGRLRDTIPSGVGKNHPAPTADAAAFFVKFGPIGRTTTTKNGHGLKEISAVQFGTLGSGNHFAEFAEDEQGVTWAIVHSGSRALGMAIAESYCATARAIPWAVRGPDAGHASRERCSRKADRSANVSAAPPWRSIPSSVAPVATPMAVMPAETAASMSHRESPTYQTSVGSTAIWRAALSRRSGAGLACA